MREVVEMVRIVSLSWGKSIVAAVICFIFGLAMFLMIEVFWASILRENITQMFEGDAYSQIFFIIILGLSIQFGVNVLFCVLLVRNELPASKLKYISYIVLACFIAEIVSFAIILLASWYYVDLHYSYVNEGLTVAEVIAQSPLLLLYYCVYILPNPAWIWLISQILFSVLFVPIGHFVIKIKKIKKNKSKKSRKKKKSKKKSKKRNLFEDDFKL